MPHVVPIGVPESYTMALAALEAGELVVLPTDTVYGIASRITEDAIRAIFAAKQRPLDRAVPVLLADAESAQAVVSAYPDTAQTLAAAFWPGPLTMALPKRSDLPFNLTHLSTVGVRVPDHLGTRQVIAVAGGALAVTSANRSDEPPPRTVQAAIAQLGDAVAVYLDGGACVGGVPSTVVVFEGNTPRIVRPGPISDDDLRAALAG